MHEKQMNIYGASYWQNGQACTHSLLRTPSLEDTPKHVYYTTINTLNRRYSMKGYGIRNHCL